MVAAMAAIVWLASFPKSGNTWLRAFLHALVADARGEVGGADINALGRFATSEAATRHYRPFAPRPPSAWNRAGVAAMRPRVHGALANARPGRVFVKTHCALTVDHGHPTIAMEVTVAGRSIWCATRATWRCPWRTTPGFRSTTRLRSWVSPAPSPIPARPT